MGGGGTGVIGPAGSTGADRMEDSGSACGAPLTQPAPETWRQMQQWQSPLPQHLTDLPGHTSTPRRHTSTPRRHTSTPRRHTSTPRRHTSTPRRHTGTPAPHEHPRYRCTRAPMCDRRSRRTLTPVAPTGNLAARPPVLRPPPRPGRRPQPLGRVYEGMRPDARRTARVGGSTRERMSQRDSGWAMSLAWSVIDAPITVAGRGSTSRQRRIAAAIDGLGTRIEMVQCGTQRPGR
jgi:hypothetical protein